MIIWATCAMIFRILYCLRWKFALFLDAKWGCKFCKSVFQFCYWLSNLIINILLLCNVWMHCVFKIFSRRRNIWCMRILKFLRCLKRGLRRLSVIVISPTKVRVISPTRIISLWKWVSGWSFKCVQGIGLFMETLFKRRQSWTFFGDMVISITNVTDKFLDGL